MIKLPSIGQEPDLTDTRLKTLRDTVLQDASDSLEAVSLTADLTEQEKALSTQLMTELSIVRFRVSRKAQLVEALTLQSEAMRNEQESFNAGETLGTNRSMERMTKASFLDFDPALLCERRDTLEGEIDVIVGNTEAEDFYTEQMAALLLRTHETMLRSRAKTDHLRYLQKRLLKRHDEISTMQTRATNEFIHTSHSVLKASESFSQDSHKRSLKLQDKKTELDSLRHEVERKSESLAKHMLAAQELDLHSKRIQAELVRVTKVHGEARKLERTNRESIRRAQEALARIRQ